MVDDQYTCSECNLIPEILNINYDTKEIEFRCEIHGDIKIHLVDFFKRELNYECQICNSEKFKKEIDSQEFSFCFDCGKVIGTNCLNKHKKEHKYIVPIKEMHLRNLHSLDNLPEENDGSNQIETILPDKTQNENEEDPEEIEEKKMFEYKPSEKDINIIKDKNIELRNKIKSLRVMLKINNILLNTYKKHPENYYNNKNITNVANSIINGSKSKKDGKDSNVRMKKIERVLLGIINSKLGTNLNGNETNIDLSNKSIGNNEFRLLSCISFNNLGELDLQNNKISDIDTLTVFNAPKLKKLDLSSNQITNVNCFKSAAQGFPNLEILLLDSNRINNVNMLNEKLFPKIKQISSNNNSFNKK